MKNLPKKPRFKKWKIITLAAVLVTLGIVFASMRSKNDSSTYSTVKVEKTNLVQEVSVTGQVKPASDVSLSFESSGKIAKVYVKVGDEVKKGQKLVALNTAELSAQARQAEASVSSAASQFKRYEATVASEKSRLDDIKMGAKKEDIQLSESKVETMEGELKDAETSLENVTSRATVDINSSVADSTKSMLIASNSAKNALMVLSDIQTLYFSDYQSESISVELAKAQAIYTLFGSYNMGRISTSSLSQLNSGLYKTLQEVNGETTLDLAESLLHQLNSALRDTKTALDSVVLGLRVSDTDRTRLEGQKDFISSQLSTISSKLSALQVQKSSNESSIRAAEARVSSAQNSLIMARKELALKRSGPRADEVKGQESAVKQAEAMADSQRALIRQAQAQAQDVYARISKMTLVAPITGQVSAVNAKEGEIAFPSTGASEPTVAIISRGQYKIEAYLPEVDIAKVQVDMISKVTLDAYGDDVVFQAKVTQLDPSETVLEGVPTYKVTLLFTKHDERVKSGMTANLDIRTAEKNDVYAIPQRAVIARNGDKVVQILDSALSTSDQMVIREVKVETGLRGSDGRIEIVSGLAEGDEVVVFKR